MGLFGGMAAGIKSGLSKFNAIDPTTGLSWADKLGAAGGALGGDRGAAMDLRMMGAQRLKQGKLDAATQELQDLFAKSQQQPAGLFGGSAPRRMGPEMDMGLPSPMGAAPQAMMGQGQPRAPMNMQSFLPALARMQGAGGDVGGYMSMIQAGMPQRKLFNTSDAIVSVDPDTGESKTVYSDAPRERQAPNGFEYVNGRMQYIPNGPEDPAVIRARAAAGRAPPRARAAGGGGGSGLPLGYGPR